MSSLDDELLLLALDRVSRGVITVGHDEYRQEFYRENGRPCLFATYLMRVLVEQDFIYSVEGGSPGRTESGRVRLDDKGHALLKRLRERQQADLSR